MNAKPSATPVGELDLARPPVSLVVCQVRHETQPAACSPSAVLGIDAALDWDTRLEEHQPISAVLADSDTGAPPPAGAAVRGWRMQSIDGEWTVTVQSDHFAIETSRYPGWEEFRRRANILIEAVQAAAQPEIEQRIGLRYVNQLQHPDIAQPADWRSLIGDALYQDTLYTSTGEDLQAVMQVVDLQPEPAHRMVMRHGFQRREGLAYILDTDCSRQKQRAFDADAITTSLERLHHMARSAFVWATTKNLRTYYA
ncbi:TIGR04255 family protein [Streptomyces sp. NBC_00827]|uniref:TIGR04255 family protein n=1 Tax=Streptomyces sp. NBC_00827 TaxID=2903677 RepID=UPI00386D66EB|nr:TIGR04255 family protein [Streptomyces sp. NBC_00827]